MKFGGTSVGDGECIRRTAELVAHAARNGPVVTVVSAMGGVTNKLIEAARRSETGDVTAAGDLAKLLREKHQAAIEILTADDERRSQLMGEMDAIIDEVESLCRGTAMLRELTPRALDSISSSGERLSSRLLASSICQLGMRGLCVEGTELIVTDGEHGQALPLAEETRARVSNKLLPLLEGGAVVIVSGFTGATRQGLLTTLGRGGSDYSATILGGALDAEEIIIWTDVDGVMTADPRLVPNARTLSEISYNEAAELAYFGAKVLHPKTLRPVVDAGIPVWIRNSFALDRPGTKITAKGHPTARGVKAITAISDVSLITISGRGMFGVPGVAAKTFTAAARARANVLLISQSSSEIDICFIVSSADAARTIEVLRETFASDSAHEQVENITVNPDIAIVAVVGEMMRGTPGIAGRTFSCLGRRNINIIAIAQGSSEYNVSFVVEAGAMREAVLAVHEEFELQHPAALLTDRETESMPAIQQ
jgi:bifunctional aspartokinase / homoserine dehydrogenase 1